MNDAPEQEDVDEQALDAFVDALLEDDPQQLYDRAPCGYLSTTPDGTVVKVNDTFLALTGHAREDLIARRRFVDLLTGGGRIYHETHYAPMLRMHGEVRGIALDLVRADGTRLPVLVNAVMERAGDGTPVVVRAAVFDATERRQYERELLEAKQRAEAERERATALARTLQQTLIPPTPPAIPGLDVAAAYRPAGAGDQVGGDFYDVFQLDTDDWVAVLGDVCGKGAEAAVVTALLRYTIRAAAVGSSRWEDVLAVTNDVLLRHDTERFCTALLLRLRRDGASWTVSAISAGHPLPLLVREGQRPQKLGSAGPLLGVMTSVAFAPDEHLLAPGETLLLYTDGVTEARSGDEFYGEDRMLRTVGALPVSPRQVVDGLLEDVLVFQQQTARDDIALLAVSPSV